MVCRPVGWSVAVASDSVEDSNKDGGIPRSGEIARVKESVTHNVQFSNNLQLH